MAQIPRPLFAATWPDLLLVTYFMRGRACGPIRLGYVNFFQVSPISIKTNTEPMLSLR